MRSLAFLSALPFRRTPNQFRQHFTMRATHPIACLPRKNMAPVFTPSFSKFFTSFFRSRHPSLAPHLRDDQIALAASLFFFKYDDRLCIDFITRNVDAITRAIADVSGKSIPEARRLFTRGVKEAAREYFKDGWADILRFVNANAKELTALRFQSTKFSAIADELASEPAPNVDTVMLQRLLDQRLPVMVMIYADYCSVCKQVRPLFEEASTEMGKKMFFVKLNGPRSPEVKEQYPFTSYPMILRCDNTTEVTPFPKSQYQMTVENIIAFAKNDELQPADSDSDNSDDDLRKFTSQRSRTYEWEAMLKKQGIDEIDALRDERKLAFRPVIDSTLESPGCDDSSCSITPSRSHDLENGDAPPLCVLLGGGMGAGKSTAIGLISETPFWKKHGDGIVVVEADAFKLNDPLFHVLQSVTPNASRIVHKDSINAAEELFVRAVNARRDVVFDGTLSWAEYARQTTIMLKDTEYYWERGPGYVETESGVIEQYWVKGEKRSRPAPGYRIELVGVTAHAEVAVMRGIVRKITTGRSVPIPDQLKSHALFSKHFENYIDMVHAAYLFDTTMEEQSIDGAGGYARQLVALKPGLLFQNPDDADDGNEFVIRNRAAYERFLMKMSINTDAKSTAELDHSTVMI